MAKGCLGVTARELDLDEHRPQAACSETVATDGVEPSASDGFRHVELSIDEIDASECLARPRAVFIAAEKCRGFVHAALL